MRTGFVAFLLTALVAGFTVVFVLPTVRGFIDRNIPGFAAATSNRFLQLIVIGSILLVAMGVLTGVLKRIRV